jgi:hypothetical protein
VKIHVQNKVTVTKTRFEITVAGAGGKLGAIGIYDALTGKIVTKVAGIDISATGVIETAFAATLWPGEYWVGFSTDDTITVTGATKGGKLMGAANAGTKATTYPLPDALPTGLTAAASVPAIAFAAL